MHDVTQTATSHPDISVSDFDRDRKIKILWTGGLDSTFRVIELSKMEVTIQPYYLCDKRCSEQNELQAISSIEADIMNHPETRCTLLPTKTIKVSELKPDEAESNAYLRLNKTNRLGSQFDWLARFARCEPGLELGMEKSTMSRGYNCIKNYGAVKLIHEGNIKYYIVDKEQSSKDLITVFGNFHFPYQLFHTTKLEEIEFYQNMGFVHLLSKVWFCHTPINDKPCGVCHPCKSVIEEGGSFRLPASAISRYKRHIKHGDASWHVKLFHLRLKAEQLVHSQFIHHHSLIANRGLLHRI